MARNKKEKKLKGLRGDNKPQDLKVFDFEKPEENQFQDRPTEELTDYDYEQKKLERLDINTAAPENMRTDRERDEERDKTVRSFLFGWFDALMDGIFSEKKNDPKKTKNQQMFEEPEHGQ